MQQHQWILHVLSDLEAYSRANNLPKVQQKVAAAREVALSEMANQFEKQFSKRSTRA